MKIRLWQKFVLGFSACKCGGEQHQRVELTSTNANILVEQSNKVHKIVIT